MRRSFALITGVGLLAASCAGTPGLSDASPSHVTSRPATTATASTSAPAFATSTTLPRLPPATRPATTPPQTDAPQPVLVGIAIHAEGFRRENDNEDMFAIHSAALLEVASIAAEFGARLTFDLSPEFMRAHSTWNSDFVEQVVALGHGVGFHADAGGDDPPFEALRDEIAAGVRALRDLVPGASSGSGVCSGSQWVEASLAAGLDTLSGVVEYCLRSLDAELLAPDKSAVESCANPAMCHGDAFTDLDRRLYPIPTSSSATWVTPDPDGGLLVLVGESASSVDCLSEGATGGGGCRLDETDAELFADWIDRYAATHWLAARPAIMVMSWSIGSIPTAEAVAGLFETARAAIDRTGAQWATVPEMGAAFRSVG